MLDWPGKLASTVFLAGCNFRCPYCHNFELVIDHEKYEDIDVDNLVSYLVSRKLWVEHIVVTGGEPTISPGISGFLKMLKESGLKVKLDTNGSRPKVLKKLINDGLVDFIAMDIKGPIEKYPEIVRAPVDLEAIYESIKTIIMSDGLEYEFRLTFVPGLLNVDDVVATAKKLKEIGAEKLVIQQFQNSSTLDESLRTRSPLPRRYLEDAVQRIKGFMEAELRGV
ncbi:MAG: anaerobic ribonucleoside-triphosphate reductase activating protein [Actinobacteria bacterium]|nr:anaerobic ribonucleoside-triphosphate reductase activating protein [Actinomycetota bacterium]